MKSALSVIRWKFVIPVGLLVAAIIVFFVVFFDPLLARGIEMAGSKVNGAKVEVSDLHTKIFKGRIDIGRLQVTNKEMPMQNIVDIGPLAFEVMPWELLKKKVIIPEAAIDGIKFNTERKTSGALPKVKKAEESKEPSAASKLAAKYTDRFKVNFQDMKFDVKDKVTFDPKETAVYKQGEELKAKATGLPDQWKGKVDTLNVDGRLKDIEAQLQEIKGTDVKGADAIKKIPEALKKLQKVKSDLNQLQADIKTTKTQALGDVTSLKSGITSLRDAKKKDVDDILSRLNLDFLKPKRLVEGLVGPVLMQRVQTTLGYVQTARRIMPSKKEEESLPEKPRATGTDVRFWTPAALPKFWLKHSSLSGMFQDISAGGTLTNVTTSPSRVGQPTKLDLKGNQATRVFVGNVTIDHVTDVKNDSLFLKLSGLTIKDMGGEQAAAYVSDGFGAAEISFNATGEEKIGGRIKLDLSKVKLNRATLLAQAGLPLTLAANASREDRIKFDLMSNIASSVEKMPSVLLEGVIGGTWNDPDLEINTNLEDEFSKAIKTSVGNVVDTQRKEIEAKLDQTIKEKSAEINAKIAEVQSKLNGVFGQHEQKVQDKIKEATGVNLSSGEGSSPIPGLKVPSLDKLFKK